MNLKNWIKASAIIIAPLLVSLLTWYWAKALGPFGVGLSVLAVITCVFVYLLKNTFDARSKARRTGADRRLGKRELRPGEYICTCRETDGVPMVVIDAPPNQSRVDVNGISMLPDLAYPEIELRTENDVRDVNKL